MSKTALSKISPLFLTVNLSAVGALNGGSIQVNKGNTLGQLVELLVGPGRGELAEGGAAAAADNAIDILRVGDQLGARGLDTIGPTDGGISKNVAEADDAAIKRSNDRVVGATLVVDEGNGRGRGNGRGGWESENGGSEKGDGGDGELHIDSGLVVEELRDSLCSNSDYSITSECRKEIDKGNKKIGKRKGKVVLLFDVLSSE